MRGGAGVLATGVALVALVGLATASGSPIVSAGLDQEVTLGDTVYLDGGGTHVPDGELDRIEWSIETPNGESIEPECVNCEQTSFVPNETGKYTVTLAAWSESGDERTDSLHVVVDGQITESGESETANDGRTSSGGGGCFVAYEGDGGDPMSQNVCDEVGEVRGMELGGNGNHVDSYILEDVGFVDRYTGVERTADGNYRVPANSLHYESRGLYEDTQNEQDESRRFGDSGPDHNSNGDQQDENRNPAGDYTLPPNYP